ncbi:MAG: hypothetical protein ACI8W8_000799 [Rhodothermales bacterium]|jgi:hypothetical protein
MKSALCSLAGILIIALPFSLLADSLKTQNVESGADRAAYEHEAVPFIKNYCQKCHGDEKQKGDLNLTALGLNMNHVETGDLWNDVYAQVQFGEMPPSKSKEQPSAREKAQFLKWLDSELIRHGRGFGLEEKLLLPEFGNYVDHKTLFDGSVTEMPYTPSRLWRQRPGIYRQLWNKVYNEYSNVTIKIGGTGKHIVKHGPHKGKNFVVGGGGMNRAKKFANPFYEFVHHASGFTDYAGILADQASLEALLTNAEAMAEALTMGSQIKVITVAKNKDSKTGNNGAMFVGGVAKFHTENRGLIPLAFNRIMENQKEVSREDFDEALKVAFNLLYRRGPEEKESAYYWDAVFQKNVPLGNDMALQAVLIYIALSPEFVYRLEIGMGEKDAHGRRFLSPNELVFALHHAFVDTPAFDLEQIAMVNLHDSQMELRMQGQTFEKQTGEMTAAVKKRRESILVAQMRAGKLNSKEDVEAVARQYLKLKGPLQTNHHGGVSRTANPRILQFFREYFGYHKAPDVFKDVEKFKGVDGFEHFEKNSAARYKYDTDSLILNILNEDKNVLYELLTTDRIYSSNLAGYNLPDLPKAAKGKKAETIRAPRDQRCGVLTQPSWLIAHSGNFDNDPVRRGKWVREKLLAGVVMDIPIGVDAKVPDDDTKTLRERFSVVEADACWRCHKKMNPLGMVFESYNHVGYWRATESGRPTNTNGKISYIDEQEIVGEVENAREMLEKIASSKLALQSFIRHIFRYWMGRNEMLSDSKTLIQMDDAYVSSEGSFKETLLALLISDSFLYRK